jgi:hypothetical protein
MIRALRLRHRDRSLARNAPDPQPERILDADALASIGIDLDEVRRRVEELFGPGALERTRAGARAR